MGQLKEATLAKAGSSTPTTLLADNKQLDLDATAFKSFVVATDAVGAVHVDEPVPQIQEGTHTGWIVVDVVLFLLLAAFSGGLYLYWKRTSRPQALHGGLDK